MESYCKGEQDEKDSVNDDLESLFENIRLGKEPDELVGTYFLPKLTEKELELVERRDTTYLQTFYLEAVGGAVGLNPDVDETKMMLSESDSKYVRGFSRRRTFVIENSSESSSELSFDNSPENYGSASDSKYVRGFSRRRTFVIENSSESSSELSFDNSPENLYDYSSEHENLYQFENSSESQYCFENCCNCSLQ